VRKPQRRSSAEEGIIAREIVREAHRIAIRQVSARQNCADGPGPSYPSEERGELFKRVFCETAVGRDLPTEDRQQRRRRRH
jgi:hypothetical protein